MADIVERLRATLLDKDNFPRMKQEKWLPVGLAEEAAAEIERLRGEISYLTDEVIPALKAEAERAHEQKESDNA